MVQALIILDSVAYLSEMTKLNKIPRYCYKCLSHFRNIVYVDPSTPSAACRHFSTPSTQCKKTLPSLGGLSAHSSDAFMAQRNYNTRIKRKLFYLLTGITCTQFDSVSHCSSRHILQCLSQYPWALKSAQIFLM